MKKTIAVIIALVVAIAPASHAKTRKPKGPVYFYHPEVAAVGAQFADAFEQYTSQIVAMTLDPANQDCYQTFDLTLLGAINRKYADYAHIMTAVYSMHLKPSDTWALQQAGAYLIQQHAFIRPSLDYLLANSFSADEYNLVAQVSDQVEAFNNLVLYLESH